MSGSDSVLLEDARVSANIRLTNNVAPDAVSVNAEKARKSHKKSKGDKEHQNKANPQDLSEQS